MLGPEVNSLKVWLPLRAARLSVACCLLGQAVGGAVDAAAGGCRVRDVGCGMWMWMWARMWDVNGHGLARAAQAMAWAAMGSHGHVCWFVAGQRRDAGRGYAGVCTASTARAHTDMYVSLKVCVEYAV